jgi:hypothetical protein
MPKDFESLLWFGLRAVLKHLAIALCLGTGCGNGVPAGVPLCAAPCGGDKLQLDGAAGEECDAATGEWQGECDGAGKRTFYTHCDYNDLSCRGPNQLCSAYRSDPSSYFCAPYCDDDAACPTIPGFRAACNFAWCVVLCREHSCPSGMVCIQHAPFLDRAGEPIESQDVCVIASR